MQTYTLTFTEQELLTLNDAIGELPTKRGFPLIISINAQINKNKKLKTQIKLKQTTPMPEKSK